MKLEPPLANLIARCQTICTADCCGVHAYDFSPVQIASYLTMYRGQPDASEIRTLRGQISALKANYGLEGASDRGATCEEMNQRFTAEQIERLTDELLASLDVALSLIEKSEELRYRSAEPVAPRNRGPATQLGNPGVTGGAASGELIVGCEHMKLEFTQNLGVEDTQVATESATPDEVLKLMDLMTWQEISMVMLTNESGVELEVSGSTEDGMSVTYTEGGKSWISSDAPTMDQCRTILRLFAAGDESWRDTFVFEFFQNADGSRGEGQAGTKPGCLGVLVVVAAVLALATLI